MKKILLTVILIVLAILLSVFFNHANAQVTVKMSNLGGVYEVPCKINGLPLRFIFDTGASDVSISLTEARFMLKNGYLLARDLLETTHYNLANGDVAEGTKIILQTLEIGGVKLSGVRASIMHNPSAPLLLGQSALKKLGKISIDYTANTLTINRESNPNDRAVIVVGRQKTTQDPQQVTSNKQDDERSGLDISAWKLLGHPMVNDESDETGKIVFKITVDGEGEITRVQTLQTTVSPGVVEVYRKAVQRIRLQPSGKGVPPPMATGTITFIITSREE
jgi:clan AA aspartic protease (TIGR02281 family)